MEVKSQCLGEGILYIKATIIALEGVPGLEKVFFEPNSIAVCQGFIKAILMYSRWHKKTQSS